MERRFLSFIFGEHWHDNYFTVDPTRGLLFAKISIVDLWKVAHNNCEH
jgi:hypothetical protein